MACPGKWKGLEPVVRLLVVTHGETQFFRQTKAKENKTAGGHRKGEKHKNDIMGQSWHFFTKARTRDLEGLLGNIATPHTGDPHAAKGEVIPNLSTRVLRGMLLGGGAGAESSPKVEEFAFEISSHFFVHLFKNFCTSVFW